MTRLHFLNHKYTKEMGEMKQCACGKLRVSPAHFYVGFNMNEVNSKLDNYRKIAEESNRSLKKTGKPTWVIDITPNEYGFTSATFKPIGYNGHYT